MQRERSSNRTAPTIGFCSQTARVDWKIDLERALCNKLFLSSLAAGGQMPPAHSAWRAQVGIQNARGADGRPLSILRMAANLGLCCHLIYFFFLLMLILCNVWNSVVSGRERWTRRARTRSAPSCSSQRLELHSATCPLLTSALPGPCPRRAHSPMGDRPVRNQHPVSQALSAQSQGSAIHGRLPGGGGASTEN